MLVFVLVFTAFLAFPARVASQPRSPQPQASSANLSPASGGGRTVSFSAWSSWGSCSVTCGQGRNRRARHCVDVVTRKDLSNDPICANQTTEVGFCFSTPCNVNGSWSAWNSWCACSAQCGGPGQQWRLRTCDNPRPLGSGLPCPVNEQEESRDCFSTPACNGTIAWRIDLTSWSDCSTHCGVGVKTRQRVCNIPAPCNYVDMECESCTDYSGCPNNNACGPYGPLSSCPAQPGGTAAATQSRQCLTQSCTPPCTDKLTPCTRPPYPTDGVWSEWGAWSFSQSCGSGIKISKRFCNPPTYGGRNCPYSDTRIEDAGLPGCPVNGYPGAWTIASAPCSYDCTTGFVDLVRQCNNPAPANGGTYCNDYILTDMSPCRWSVAPPCAPPNCDPWGSWEPCTSTLCGVPATKTRSATCIRLAPAAPVEHLCFNILNNTFIVCLPGDPACSNSTCSCIRPDRLCIDSNGNLIDAIDGCTTLLTGFRGCCDNKPGCVYRPGDANTAAQFCPPGDACQPTNPTCLSNVPQDLFTGVIFETQPCTTTCPINATNQWSDWSSCSVTCGAGTKVRNLLCTSVNNAVGTPCDPPSVQLLNCSNPACPINGQWTTWTSWSTCAGACGVIGKREIHRDCTNPAPSNFGKPCKDWVSTPGQIMDTVTLTTADTSAECQTKCSAAPDCRSYNYCGVGKKCELLRITAIDGVPLTDPNCNHYYAGGGIAIIGVVITAVIRVIPATTPEACGAACVTTTNPRCRSFDFITTSSLCTLYTVQSIASATHNGLLQSCSTSAHYELQYVPNVVIEDCVKPACATIYGEFSAWSNPDITCGNGCQSRSETCADVCHAVLTEVRSYNATNCATDGHWSPWGAWSLCSATCGNNAAQTRTRTCNHPAPIAPGADCPGVNLLRRSCAVIPCPINGGLSDWKDVQPCQSSCTKLQIRKCNNPVPQNGGLDCTGTQTRDLPCTGGACRSK